MVYAREKQDDRRRRDVPQSDRRLRQLAGAHIAYGDYLASKNDKAGALREWTTASAQPRQPRSARASRSSRRRSQRLQQSRRQLQAFDGSRRQRSAHVPAARSSLHGGKKLERRAERVQGVVQPPAHARRARRTRRCRLRKRGTTPKRSRSTNRSTKTRAARQSESGPALQHGRSVSRREPDAEGESDVQPLPRRSSSRGRKATTRCKQIIADSITAERRAPKPRRNRRRSRHRSRARRPRSTPMLVVYDESLTRHLAGVPHIERPDRVRVVAAELAQRGLLDERDRHARATDARNRARARRRATSSCAKRECERLDAGEYGELTTGDTDIDANVVRGRAARRRRRAVGARARGHREARGVRARAAAGPSCRTRARHGLLPVQQRRDRGARVHRGDRRTRADRRLRLPSRQRTQALVGDGFSYVSTHAMPAYPGTGSDADNRIAAGGALVNVPLAAERHLDRSVRCDLGVGAARSREASASGHADRERGLRFRRRRSGRRPAASRRARRVQLGRLVREVADDVV